jgi:hypothetical protein
LVDGVGFQAVEKEEVCGFEKLEGCGGVQVGDGVLHFEKNNGKQPRKKK